MAEVITLLKEQQPARQVSPSVPRRVRNYPVEVITGMLDKKQRCLPCPPRGSSINLTNSRPIALPDRKQIERLAYFVDAFIVKGSERRRSCLAFGAFIRGDVRFHDAFPPHGPAKQYVVPERHHGEQVAADALRPGTCYLAEGVQQLVLSIDRGYSLSVWDGGPLVVCRNVDFLDVYQASHFTRVAGRLCLAKA